MILRRLRPYVAALLIAGASFIGVAPPAYVAAASASPPVCAYKDVPAANTAYTDWDITMLDTIYRLPRNYVPPKLVSTAKAGLKGGGEVRSFVIPDLKAMVSAARKAGSGLRVISAYRSYASQSRLYQQEVARYGKKTAIRGVARPGHSEHQLGVTIDFGSATTPGDVSQKFARTSAGHWMRDNGWKFGWVLSYPSGETSKTCYFSEPWHYRYVGPDMAQKIHDSHLTLREYLWKHYASK